MMLVGALFVSLDRPVIGIALFAAARFAYVAFVGVALRVQERGGLAGVPVETAFARFRATAELIMWADAVAFVVLCLLTPGTLRLPASIGWWPTALAGVALVALGLGVKVWAARTVGGDTYYWRDFFVPEEGAHIRSGPYRWLKDPMYTVGYAHVYGFALTVRSREGLVAAAAAQAAILLLHVLVELPHTKRLRSAASGLARTMHQGSRGNGVRCK